ncbi:hypothetical protein B0A49_10047 [Cryomyces minteri]|uniref:AAA+ ATPase domain-containing protein n=1 Tax=Cryomyces minteri TaxID=331657 RepID=A0A4U0WL72_9PEZI|nr:hypothetical protein B0A49_10047 [Cryomyces minteri]
MAEKYRQTFEGAVASFSMALKEAPWRKVTTIDDSTLDRTTRQNKSTITEVFAEAVAHEPSIVVIDKLEAIAGSPDRESGLGDSLASVLAMELDKLKYKQVLVVGTTSKPNDVDKRLRTPGRFRYEIEVPIPDLHARIAILEVLGDACVSTYDYPMEKIGERTHGFVGADLEALYEAALDSVIDRQYEEEEKVGVHALKENGVLDPSSHPLLEPEGFDKGRTIADVDGKAVIEILQEDWEKALLEVRPTAMKEVFIETPKVRWTDIGGSADVKDALTQVIEWPLKFPEKLAELELESSKGILLYGPPGCSKTLTAKAIATEAGLNFIAVKGAEFIQSYVGESERALRGIFDKARQASPSVIFFDEIDAIGASSRGQQSGLNIVTTLLNEMDGIGGLQGVLVLAATNKPEILDPALLRPGRFDELIYIGPPNLEARIEIINLRTRSKPLDPDVNVAALALRTDGYSGAELVSVCMEATKSYMKRWVELETLGEQMSTTEAWITQQDFDHALGKVVSRITPEMTRRYELWSQGASG